MQTLSFDTFARERQLPSAKSVYISLINGQAPERDVEISEHFLYEQLALCEHISSDLPEKPQELETWMHANVERVGALYHAYLEERNAGKPRRYFRNKAHALFFLKCVAPTKLVDGAWLYGLLPHWQDPRFTSLIQTYLEELGEGSPTKNHVVLYHTLLASQDIERWDDLRDEHYVQGAIQLALAHHADHFLPEVVGFNLGYEQLPLHLLITAYELKELGIDPYYFTLHITVDNADSGHAKQAVDAVFAVMPRVGDAEEFWRRVRNGYKLNELGPSTTSVVAEFDLEREMMTIFARKSDIGKYAHSDYRRVENRTVNDWLSNSNDIAAFMQAMEAEGWFKRHQDPANSRFWRMIQSEKAKMFGVFSVYEQQVIYDWIAGDAPRNDFAKQASAPRLSFEAKRKFRQASAHNVQPSGSLHSSHNDFDAECCALEQEVVTTTNECETMEKLIRLMSPSLHHSASGLEATRLFNEILK